MQKFEFMETKIENLKLIKSFIATDNRGYFKKLYEKNIYKDNGIDFEPYEENCSLSRLNTIRGLHFQKKFPQDKIITVLNGRIFDVAVDLRKNSKTFGKWQGFELSAENKLSFYIPKGFAHGFITLEDNSFVHYLIGNKYDPDSDSGILWNDADLNITWPVLSKNSLIISKKDQKLPTLKTFIKIFGGF